MKKFTWFDAASIVVWLIPIVYLFIIYPKLPARVPLHFGVDGQADSYGQPNDLFGVQLLFSGVSAGVYLLLKFLPKIDPKQKVKYSAETFQKIALGIVLLLSAVNIMVLFASYNGSFNLDKLIFPAISLFFAFMGNVMHSVKPNYFVGIRTPWTLESEETWRATHRLAGKIWFVGGIMLAALTLILTGQAAFIVFTAGVAILATVPTAYSFIYYKKHQLKG